MTNEEILDEIVAIIPRETFRRYGEPGILRRMNMLYKELNRSLNCLEKSLTITEATYTLPSYVIAPFDIFVVGNPDQKFEYFPPEVFRSTDFRRYTIRGGQIEFSSTFVEGTTTVTMWYYSSGKSLVIASNLESDEANSPEWHDAAVHSVLVFGVVCAISQNHESFAHDYQEYMRLRKELGKLNYQKQFGTPIIPLNFHTPGANEYIDEFER